jgi:NadR type nicotinamide-nucleotide adenylyltransferase
MQEVKKIVIIGPESTGKSTLCELLAQHYDAVWCPEFAREYLLTNGTDYDYDDLLNIAKGQLALEDEYSLMAMNKWKMKPKVIEHSQPLLFVDTDMYVMKVWCEFVFGNCHQFILDEIIARKTDLYLLCNTDLPWVKDELREYPDHDTREQLYHIYKDILINQTVPWVNIHGENDERVQLAIQAIDDHFFAATGV